MSRRAKGGVRSASALPRCGETDFAVKTSGLPGRSVSDGVVKPDFFRLKVVGAAGFEPAAPCAQVPRPAIIGDSLQLGGAKLLIR